MSFWLTVAGMVTVTFGSRYAGLVRRTELPDFYGADPRRGEAPPSASEAEPRPRSDVHPY